MTDDEAFVRAVVDAPGDDTPRLVYADWLDDHDDPARAAYLRAERAAVRTGDVVGLRGMAADLDPVWVARVSRPPVGVCCEATRFSPHWTPGPPLTVADIDAFADRVGTALPAEYRALLLNRNGGQPYPNGVRWPEGLPHPGLGEQDGVVGLGVLWAVNPAADVGHTRRLDPRPLRARDGILLPVAETDGHMVWCVRLIGTPNVWFGSCDYDGYIFRPPDSEPVFPSLGHLFAALTPTDPVWLQCLVRGDHTGFDHWLATDPDLLAVADEDDGRTVLDFAVEWKRPEMVRALLSRGAKLTNHTRRLAAVAGDDRITALIDEYVQARKRKPRSEANP